MFSSYCNDIVLACIQNTEDEEEGENMLCWPALSVLLHRWMDQKTHPSLNPEAKGIECIEKLPEGSRSSSGENFFVLYSSPACAVHLFSWSAMHTHTSHHPSRALRRLANEWMRKKPLLVVQEHLPLSIFLLHSLMHASTQRGKMITKDRRQGLRLFVFFPLAALLMPRTHKSLRDRCLWSGEA